MVSKLFEKGTGFENLCREGNIIIKKMTQKNFIFRPIDGFYSSYVDLSNPGKNAADQILDNPQSHLLS
jgi:hypothetical protein